MGSRFDYEEKFDRAQQRAQRRNDEIVRKFHHKSQNVFRTGEMFKVDLVGFYVRNKYGMWLRIWESTDEKVVVSLQDSDRFITHTERCIDRGLNSQRHPYHLWPFLYESDVVWYISEKVEDAMDFLRGAFKKRFKLVK